MHVSKADLEPTVFGEYEGRSADAACIRIAFESMPAQFPPDEPRSAWLGRDVHAARRCAPTGRGGAKARSCSRGRTSSRGRPP
jgi:hypothetical protein